MSRPEGSRPLPTGLVDRDLIQVPYTSITAFVDEVVGYADAVVVLEPEELRERVVTRLDAASALDPTPGRTGHEEVSRRG